MRKVPTNTCHWHWLCQAGSVFTVKLKSVPCVPEGWGCLTSGFLSVDPVTCGTVQGTWRSSKNVGEKRP